MIEIKNINGATIYSGITTDNSSYSHELMSHEYIELDFNTIEWISLSEGCYIEYKGRKFYLYEPHLPEVVDGGWHYTPKFKAEWMGWSGVMMQFIDTSLSKTETTWELTGGIGLFLEAIVNNIKRARGEIYTFSYDPTLTEEITLSFDSTSVLDVIGQLAQHYETEWWIEGTIIHLSQCRYGDEIALTTGVNVGIPDINSQDNDYATRFFFYGSTRNITQDYAIGDGNINQIVEKRLHLPTSKYPDGYIDIKPDLHPEEVIEKTVIFDDIYPRSALTISNVEQDLRYLLDDDGNKVVDHYNDGTPVYKTYSIFRFKIPGFILDKDDLLPQMPIMVHFKDGMLNGYEFELIYRDSNDDSYPNTYEIQYITTSGGLIIPNISMMPEDGDSIILFNIKMPDDYIVSAENELEETALKYINEDVLSNKNNYIVQSYPKVFYDDNIVLSVGRNVLYTYRDIVNHLRVLSLSYNLTSDKAQNITLGLIKKTTRLQSVETQIINVTNNVQIVEALDSATRSIQDSLSRSSNSLKEAMSNFSKWWMLDDSDPANPFIYTTMPTLFRKGAAFYEGEPGGGGGTGGGLIQKVYDYSDLSGSFDNSDLTDTFNAYTIAQLAARLSTQENAGYVTSAQLASALIGKADKATTLAGYGITDGVTQTGLSSALAGYSTKTEVANTCLPLSGGTLTGQVVISPSIKGGNLVVAGSELGAGGGQTNLTADLPKYASYFGTLTIGGTWYNVLSLRHRNGAGDGDKYGMYLYTNMTSGGNLVWNKQTYGTIWQGERTLLDSANFNSYAPTKTGDGATGTWGISITGNAATATAAQAVINGGSVNPLTFNTNTENTTDSWVLVQKGTEIQHRNMTTLSVASAANSDTLDGLHAAAFGRRYVLGTTTDAQMCYVLLGKAYTSGAVITGFAVTGTLFFNRGGGVLEHDRVDIVASAQYINNAARWVALGTHAEAYRAVLVTYQGARWIAVERSIITAVDVTFEGVAMNGVEFHLVTASQVSDVVAFGDNTLYATATNARALNATRYLWGRPFKGDEDVSGALTGVTEITNSGRYLSTNSGMVGTNGFQCRGGGVDATFGINPATGGPYIWVASAHALRFATSGAERMRITADGQVGIGTTDPTAALHIVGASAHVHLDSADGYPYLTFFANGVAKGTVGHNPTYGAYIKNNDGNHRIFILNDSTVGVLKADSTIAYCIAVDSNNNITITPAGGQITLNANVRINGKTTFVNG